MTRQIENTVDGLDVLADKCLDKCHRENWQRNWSNGGCYLHLEASEFIESLRGKRGNPASEAADVLFVLLAMMKENNVSIEQAIRYLEGVVKV